MITFQFLYSQGRTLPRIEYLADTNRNVGRGPIPQVSQKFDRKPDIT